MLISRYIDKEYCLEKRCDARNRRKNELISAVKILLALLALHANKFRKITVFRIEVTNQIEFRILDRLKSRYRDHKICI